MTVLADCYEMQYLQVTPLQILTNSQLHIHSDISQFPSQPTETVLDPINDVKSAREEEDS